MRIGIVIREKRLEMGMSITELAQKCQLGVNTISRIEQGKSNGSEDTINRIEKVLGPVIFDLTLDKTGVQLVWELGLLIHRAESLEREAKMLRLEFDTFRTNFEYYVNTHFANQRLD